MRNNNLKILKKVIDILNITALVAVVKKLQT